MRQANAKSIRRRVFEYCATIRHPFPKRVYRRVKKAFLQIPRPLRSKFNPATGTI